MTGTAYLRQGVTAADQALPIFYEALRDRMAFSLGWREGAAPAEWRKAGLAKARELILPSAGDVVFDAAFDMAVLDEVDRGSYAAKKIVFNVSADTRAPALLLVPRGTGPFPAALMLHDHGDYFVLGKEKVVETWDDGDRPAASKKWVERCCGGLYPGDELAKRGYVVLAVDALGWGDRSAPGFTGASQQALASNCFNLGTSFAGIIAMEDIRAADFLSSLPEVDRSRLAAVGFSMGAFRAWQCAALADSVSACVAGCWMATMQGLMTPGNKQLQGQSAFAMLHPFIGKYLDYPDVAGLAAPKPMLVFAGAKDELFPVDSAREAFRKMEDIWKAYGAQEKFRHVVWEERGHEFAPEQQRDAFDWLDQHFGNR